MKKIIPLNNQVLVRMYERKDRMIGSLFIPNLKKGQTNYGTILAVSEDVEENLNVGDKVILENYGGTDIPDPNNKDKTLRLQKVDTILLKIFKE